MDKKTFESADNSTTNTNENLSTNKKVVSEDEKTTEVSNAKETIDTIESEQVDFDNRDGSRQVHTLDRKNKYSDLDTSILVKDLDLYYGDFQALSLIHI